MKLSIRITSYSLALGSLFLAILFLCDSNNRARVKDVVSRGKNYYSNRELELIELLSSTDEEIERAKTIREKDREKSTA